jgi:hypothetical protein
MSDRKKLSWSLGAGSVLLLALAGFCCVRRETTVAAPRAAPATGEEALPVSSAVPDPSQATRDAGTVAARALSSEPTANPVARSMEQHDADDRALLAELERTSGRAPPPQVHELLALRRQGKTREELAQFITDHLSGELSVRVAAQRWLSAVTKPDGDTSPHATPTAPLGQGGNPRHVQPLKPKPANQP